MEYIVLVSYESDAERKRIDYLVEKWNLRKLKGIVIHVDAENPQEFFEELFSRLEGNVDEKVEVYEVKRVKKKVETKKKRLEFTIKEEKKIVERFIDYLLSKMNASYVCSDALAKVYSVYTRKGKSDVKVEIRGNGKTTVIFEIEGYGDVVDFLAEKIKSELRLFAGD